ncbi:conserved hypothetical protein [uncultured Pleomorphomonas sp.]|uniref:DUF2065 domain-containing protein n=2 Tax=Pleomorphomonas TaxID=261933 RepID=A0A2G9X0X3_9HYPH|nr:DUF2065 domain-containing protein [Pleomorphomonas carboxyditropha]PIP00618.1 hypothetical protein CJ014_00485 [Pleomorphomonas carboxyditropha]SCM72240.1 conserved hypothetical protein [uncultured Pleomorphomonas sp.]
MNDFLVAVGLMAVLEGLLYAAAPSLMRKGIRQMLEASDVWLRTGGIAAMAVGVAVIWAVRGG